MREPKNIAERACAKFLTEQGWEVTRRGYPDFICYRGNELILVEVKRGKFRKLRDSQLRLFAALGGRGVKVFKYDPESGLVRL